jgi:hypothetical protein
MMILPKIWKVNPNSMVPNHQPVEALRLSRKHWPI